MKKVLALALGMLLIPMAAFGMEAMDDSAMDSVTGQSGVAIALDDVKVWQHEGASELWYVTNFGNDAFYNNTAGAAGVSYGSANDAGVGLVYGEDSYSMTHVNAIGAINLDRTELYSPGRSLQGSYPSGTVNATNGTEITTTSTYNFGNLAGDTRFKPSALTIHVSDDLKLIGELVGQADGQVIVLDADTGANIEVTGVNAVAGIRIGLPTVEIYVDPGSRDELEILVSQGEAGYNPLEDNTNEHSFGTLFMTQSGSTTAILDGYLEIAPLSGYVGAIEDGDLDYTP